MTTRQRVGYTVLMIVAFLSLFTAVGWWFVGDHVAHNFHGRAHPVDVVLFVLLSMVFLHRLFMDAFSWVVAWKVEPRRTAPPAPPYLRVAFITTFVPGAETVELLQTTLPAIVSVDFPHDTWVLDEGDDPAVRKLCASLGVRHFSRWGNRKYNHVAGPFTRKTKGGNHNAWYDAHGDDYDVVAQIDTDFIPRHDFLTRTLGYFRDERVAFVGTPQVYGNEGKSLVAKGSSQQLYMFYGPMMRGLSARGMCTMIGANHVVRVAALREIGLYAGHLTEDLITGMRLHSQGWKSVYVAEPLAVGEAPVTWKAYFNQQMRWAFGCIDILRNHSMKLTRTMGRKQALLYLSLQQHYFTGIAMLVGVGLLSAYFFGGIFPADVHLTSMLIYSTPLLVMRQFMMLALQRLNTDPSHERGLLLAGRYTAAVSWPIYLLAAIGVMRQKHLVFKVTPKGSKRVDRERTPLGLITPHAVIGVVSLAGLGFGVFTGRTAGPLVVWAAITTVLMLTFVTGIVIGELRPRRRAALHRPIKATATVEPIRILLPAASPAAMSMDQHVS